MLLGQVRLLLFCKILLKDSYIHLHIAFDYFHITTAKLSPYDRGHGPRSPKYLLSDPLQKKFADPILILYYQHQ